MDYRKVKEEFGTVTKVYETNISSGGKEMSMIVSTNKKLSNGNYYSISCSNEYGKFQVGDKVVCVTYEYERPITEEEKEEYIDMDEEYPEMVDQTVHTVFDADQYRKGLCDEEFVILEHSRRFGPKGRGMK